MAKPRSFVQKWLLEIRFEQKPSMFWLGGEMADRWVKDFPELEVTIPNYRLIDKTNYRLVQFGYNNAVLDIEGMKDIETFIKMAQRLAMDVGDIIHPEQIVRLGMRQINLLSTPSGTYPLADMLKAFGPQKERWDTHQGRDQVSDIGMILNFKSERFDGQLHFGPYVPGVNNVQNFSYGDHIDLKSFRNGYIFNCDYGERNMDPGILAENNLAEWMRGASIVMRERIEQIRHYIYHSEE